MVGQQISSVSLKDLVNRIKALRIRAELNLFLLEADLMPLSAVRDSEWAYLRDALKVFGNQAKAVERLPVVEHDHLAKTLNRQLNDRILGLGFRLERKESDRLTELGVS